MKKITVTIEEHITQDFVVEANDMEEAMEIAKEKYKNGDFVILPGVVNTTLMAAYEPGTNEYTEFVEF